MSALGDTLSDGLTVTRRNITKLRRIPDVIVFSLIQPVMFIVLFVYVFGSAIEVPGVEYEDYLIPGIFAQTLVFGSALTGLGLAEDLQKGIIDRFRSLPMARSAVLVGRTAADLLNNALVLVVMVLVGLLVGWRPTTGPLPVAAGILLMLLFAYAFSWISATIGLAVRSVEVAQSAGFIWLFPVTFLSNVFVQPAGLNDVLRVVAEWNPVSALAAAVRDLFGNESSIPVEAWPLQHAALVSVGWSLLILAVFVPLSVNRYRKAAAR
ncbi:ABC transporter permease [Vallicoccus soli]|uniref:Transport permease protein n=1 Tax=Vallicoccus soli TaxID=2339232 RepID=A0A3A3ZMN0_9ACTN|nr:ABC transporter permease [Vallicoccus soli]RJK97945.1 ABC transporter permease [Vallicoccus soli]